MSVRSEIKWPKYHYPKWDDLSNVSSTTRRHIPRYVLKTLSRSAARRASKSLFFDYTIVAKFDTLEEANQEALFQSELAPRTRYVIVDSQPNLAIAYYYGGKQVKSPEESLRDAYARDKARR